MGDNSHLPLCLLGKARRVLTHWAGPPHTDDEDDDNLGVSSQQLDLKSDQKSKATFVKILESLSFFPTGKLAWLCMAMHSEAKDEKYFQNPHRK